MPAIAVQGKTKQPTCLGVQAVEDFAGIIGDLQFFGGANSPLAVDDVTVLSDHDRDHNPTRFAD